VSIYEINADGAWIKHARSELKDPSHNSPPPKTAAYLQHQRISRGPDGISMRPPGRPGFGLEVQPG
jgi:hypothetical protein